jgi:Mg-chelatase subunit ChlD
MARRRSRLSRLVDSTYLLIVLAIWGALIWAFVQFIYSDNLESVAYDLSDGRRVEMLDPIWLGLALLAPPLWLLRKWSLSDLPWLQQLLNVTLRTLLLLAICLAATRVVITTFKSQVSMVFLVDVSQSVPDGFLDEAQRYVQEVYSGRGTNRVAVVTFARDAHELSMTPGSSEIPPIQRHEGDGAGLQSNLDVALRLAYGLFPQDHLRRAVILSDGNLNRGDVVSEAYNASRYGIRLYAHELDYERLDEVLIRAVRFPDDEITAHEPFEVRIDIFSTHEGEVSLDITQNDFRDVRGRSLHVLPGLTQHYVELEVYDPGQRTFEIEIESGRDQIVENNRAVHVVDVEGRQQVLYVEGESRRRTYLSRALDEERNSRVNFDLDVRTARGFPTGLDEMEGFDLIILSDVEARYVSRTAMSNLREYVEGGGSFLMIGGESSFGPGGYQGTTMEEILPVTFESRRNETMPSVALMIIIDRSGSMDGLRLEMAKDAARAAVELLGPQDRVGVIAFDTSPTQIVRLQSASNRVRISEDISRITPGGGTDIYPALEDALLQLSTTRARIKHVILLTDGEAPREGISELASEMRSERITVSTVGVGSGVDRNLLEMIADISGGHFYQTNSAANIPQIFVQDTSQVTRTSLVEDPFRPQVVTDSAATRGIDFSSAPYLLGYVSTRARRGATVGLASDLGEPIYAWRRLGRGRTAVFTSDCKNRWMVEWIREPIYPRFWAQVTRHLMRRQSSGEDRLDMDVWVEGGRGHLRVDAIAADDSFINGLTSTVTISAPGVQTFEVELQQTAAGRYEQEIGLPGYGSYLIEAVHRRGDETFAVSRASLDNHYPDEYLTVDDDYGLIAQLVRMGNGRVNPTTRELFDPEGEQLPSERELWPYFLFSALGLLLLDILFRRVRIYGRTALDWAEVTAT